MNDSQWMDLANYFRSKLVSLYDPTSMFIEKDGLSALLQHPHKGFYVGIVSSSDKDILREGFMKDGLSDLKGSVDTVVQNSFVALKNLNITKEVFQTSTVFFTVITDCQYIVDPLSWDENKDGVYFMWGQKYSSLYLPYQVSRMSIPKVEIMDRLCASSGMVSNLWKLPEGLVFKVSAVSYKS